MLMPETYARGGTAALARHVQDSCLGHGNRPRERAPCVALNPFPPTPRPGSQLPCVLRVGTLSGASLVPADGSNLRGDAQTDEATEQI